MENNRNDLIINGNKAFEKHDWKEAIYYLGQASLIENSFEINKKIVISLMKIGMFEDAIDQSSAYYEKYLQNVEDSKLLFNVFLDSGEFIKAHEFYEIIKNKEYSNKIYEEIRKRENEFQIKNVNDIENSKKELMSLVTLPIGVQASKIRNMKYLSLDDYISVSRNLLLNPYLHPLLKNEVLDNLVKLGINDTYSINFYGELKEFNPSNISTVMNSKLYLEALDELKKRLENFDDTESSLLLNEFLIYISMLNPFMTEIISNINEWIDVYLSRYVTPEKEISNSVITEWLDRFNKLLNSFNE